MNKDHALDMVFGRNGLVTVLVALGCGCGGCASHEADALHDLGLSEHPVLLRISISVRGGNTVDLTDSSEIGYFLSHLRSLSPRAQPEEANEFDLTFYQGDDGTGRRGQPHITSLHMGRSWIGPFVPATDAVKRWYFGDDSLYAFICGKLHIEGR